MKHPILYRVAFYGILASLCASILLLLSLMGKAPFSSLDMRLAYLNGCNFASKPLTDESVKKCVAVADMFKETLDDLDKQMEKFIK
jgi:hypothetical protein